MCRMVHTRTLCLLLGVYRSTDGVTWTSISDTLFPSTMPWRLIPDEA